MYMSSGTFLWDGSMSGTLVLERQGKQLGVWKKHIETEETAEKWRGIGWPTAEKITMERWGNRRGDSLEALTIIEDFFTLSLEGSPVEQ